MSGRRGKDAIELNRMERPGSCLASRMAVEGLPVPGPEKRSAGRPREPSAPCRWMVPRRKSFEDLD